MPDVTAFVVALPSEARPLIGALKLQRDDAATGFKVYKRENIRLVISGIGKIASASAVAYLAGFEATAPPRIWINLGIAGHAYLPIGSLGLAHSIHDQVTTETHYPSIAFRTTLRTHGLACYDEPTTNYPGDSMCDMESAGFFVSASRFSHIEFIQTIKVVSDNSPGDIEALDRARISELVERAIDPAIELAGTLQKLALKHAPPVTGMPIDLILQKWRFTTTQRLQLQEIARRWALTSPESQWPPPALGKCRTSREALAELVALIDAKPLRLA